MSEKEKEARIEKTIRVYFWMFTITSLIVIVLGAAALYLKQYLTGAVIIAIGIAYFLFRFKTMKKRFSNGKNK